jgi:hypothetical protein
VLAPTLLKIAAGKEFQAGEWCKFCRFRRDCSVRAEVGLSNVFTSLAEPVPVVSLTPERKAEILPLLDTIKSWLKDFEKGAIADLIAGKTLGGWKLVEGRSNRGWSDPNKVAPRISPDDAFIKKLRSPAQLEKLFGKPAFVKKLGDLVVKPPGKPKLVGPEDKRPAITNLSECDFSDLSEETTDE